jgi:hypothetical protein
MLNKQAAIKKVDGNEEDEFSRMIASFVEYICDGTYKCTKGRVLVDCNYLKILS